MARCAWQSTARGVITGCRGYAVPWKSVAPSFCFKDPAATERRLPRCSPTPGTGTATSSCVASAQIARRFGGLTMLRRNEQMPRSKGKVSATLIDQMEGEASWLLSHAQALTDYGRQEEAAVEFGRAAACE